MAVVDQPLHQMDDFRNVFRGLGMHGGRTYPQRLRVLVVCCDKPVRQFLDGDSLLVGPPDHLVVDVRKVLHKGHLVSFPLQLPPQHVKGDETGRAFPI